MDHRRAVYNAVFCGRDPFTLGIPRAEVSWHIIWLAHQQHVRIDDHGTLTATARPARPAA